MGVTTLPSNKFCCLASSNFLTWAATVSSSTFSNNKPIFVMFCPSDNKSARPASFQVNELIFRIVRNFSAVKGMKGSHKIERFAAICKPMFRIVPVLSVSVLITFHGSVSAKYLFPKRATSIINAKASRSLKFAMASPILLGISAKVAKV